MITDQNVVADVREQWQAIEKRSQSSHRQYGTPAGFINETPPEELFNLPFVLAFAVLDQVLDALIEQGVFRCKKNKLGAKMAASKGVLNWRNYEHVDQARCARNTLAHEAKLVSKGQALELIQAIRDELKGWRILEE